MPISIHRIKGAVTPTAGTVATTLILRYGLLRQIYIDPATATTSYDVKLTDVYNLDTMEWTEQQGKLNDASIRPVYSNYTLTIENASQDEQFDFLIVYEN